MAGTASFASAPLTRPRRRWWASQGWDTALVLLPLIAAWQVLSWRTGNVALASPAATAARLAGLIATAAFWGSASCWVRTASPARWRSRS